MVHPRLKQITSDSVIFADGSSIPIPDRIIYACGYLYAYPFIENNLVWSEQHLQNLSKQPSDLKPLTDGLVVNDLYQYMVYIHNPTLAILGVPQKIAPFSLYEYQAYFLTQVYQGILPLPSFQDMLEEWEQLVARYPGKELLTIGMRQVDYRDSMIELIERYGDGSSASKERLGYTGHDSEWAKRCAEVFSLRRNLLWSEWLRSTQ
ncbi:hypothetical protein GGI07_001935 [Coemansia sp. Benny D115]|nr:hypothetical protein GGI07_001935 [Coemansia sp. Benny D115]